MKILDRGSMNLKIKPEISDSNQNKILTNKYFHTKSKRKMKNNQQIWRNFLAFRILMIG